MFARALFLAVALVACGPSAPTDHPIAESTSVAREAFTGFNGAEHQFLSDTSGAYMAKHYIACPHNGTVYTDERRMMTTAYDPAINQVHILDQPASGIGGLKCEGTQAMIGTCLDAKHTVTDAFAPIVNTSAPCAVNNGQTLMWCTLGGVTRTNAQDPQMNIATVLSNTFQVYGPYAGNALWINRIDYHTPDNCTHTVIARYVQQN